MANTERSNNDIAEKIVELLRGLSFRKARNALVLASDLLSKQIVAEAQPQETAHAEH